MKPFVTKEKLKIAIIGPSSSGKSYIVSKFIAGSNWNDTSESAWHNPTIEDEHHVDILLQSEPTSLHIVDTGFQYYQELHNKWILQCEAFLVVYSICSRKSFKFVNRIIDDIYTTRPSQTVPILLVGNKADCTEAREVPTADGMQLAESMGCEFMEISAKNDNVDQLFIALIKAQGVTKIPKIAWREYISHRYKSFADVWSTKPEIPKEWKFVVTDTALPGYHLETGRNDVIYAQKEVAIEEADKDIPWYNFYFLNKDHSNFINTTDPDVDPVILSVEPCGRGVSTRVIVRCKTETRRILVPSFFSATNKDIIKFIKGEMPELAEKSFRKVENGGDLLIEFEKQEISSKYKFGVLYVKEGQTEEDQFYSNTETSPQFEQFLDFLGTRVQLKDYQGYLGGLDNKSDSTGTHSIATSFGNFDIMFHVSTLLPSQFKEKNRVERKRHLGNDVVLIIFKEGDTPFDPNVMKSHFNSVFVIVQVENQDGKTFFNISVTCKSDVDPFGPYLKHPALYTPDENFRRILLTKLINGERSAQRTGEFLKRMLRTRTDTLKHLSNKLLERSKKTISHPPPSLINEKRKSTMKQIDKYVIECCHGRIVKKMEISKNITWDQFLTSVSKLFKLSSSSVVLYASSAQEQLQTCNKLSCIEDLFKSLEMAQMCKVYVCVPSLGHQMQNKSLFQRYTYMKQPSFVYNKSLSTKTSASMNNITGHSHWKNPALRFASFG